MLIKSDLHDYHLLCFWTPNIFPLSPIFKCFFYFSEAAIVPVRPGASSDEVGHPEQPPVFPGIPGPDPRLGTHDRRPERRGGENGVVQICFWVISDL